MNYNPHAIRVSFDICNYCNLACQYCSAQMPYINHSVKKEISLENIKIILYYLNKYFSKFEISFSIKGGEPTLYHNVSNIIDTLYSKTHNLGKINLLTNNTMPLAATGIDFNKIHCLITYHFSQIHNTKKSDTFLENIRFLCDNNYSHEIIILTDKTVKDSIEVNNTYNTIKQVSHNVKIAAAFPIHQYVDNDYDYTKIQNAYNTNYTKEVYYMRNFKIDYDLLYCYTCDLTVNVPLYNRKIIYPEVWEYILSNINKKIVCKFKECACPNLCYTTE